MYGEARKLHLIEQILKIEDEQMLYEVEALIKNKLHIVKPKGLADFSGTLTDEEANEMIRVIDEGCAQIHPDDWK